MEVEGRGEVRKGRVYKGRKLPKEDFKKSLWKRRNGHKKPKKAPGSDRFF